MLGCFAVAGNAVRPDGLAGRLNVATVRAAFGGLTSSAFGRLTSSAFGGLTSGGLTSSAFGGLTSSAFGGLTSGGLSLCLKSIPILTAGFSI